MNEVTLSGPHVVIVAIIVLWLGKAINNRVSLLDRYSIPLAVSGGFICSLLVLIVDIRGGPSIRFDMQLRDTLLLIFFSTIGISAKFARLMAGGRALVVLVVCAVFFLVLQNVTGVGLALWFDAHPGLGLFAGSVSLAGGHGTAIAWGQEAAAAGIEGAAEVGILFATFGLIAGGIVGGPFAEYLIRRNRLSPAKSDEAASAAAQRPILSVNTDGTLLERALDVLFVLALCVVLGDLVNRFLFERDFKVPGFLTAMLVGIALTNLADRLQRPLRQEDFDGVGQVSLQLFLAMSLMSMDLSILSDGLTRVMLVLGIQILVMALFAEYVVFRVMGGDYDAAVIAGGFCGLGMGATPVAIANMNAITLKHGPSFKAFLVIPLVGAFFIDISNALIVKFFLSLPLLSSG